MWPLGPRDGLSAEFWLTTLLMLSLSAAAPRLRAGRLDRDAAWATIWVVLMKYLLWPRHGEAGGQEVEAFLPLVLWLSVASVAAIIYFFGSPRARAAKYPDLIAAMLGLTLL